MRERPWSARARCATNRHPRDFRQNCSPILPTSGIADSLHASNPPRFTRGCNRWTWMGSHPRRANLRLLRRLMIVVKRQSHAEAAHVLRRDRAAIVPRTVRPPSLPEKCADGLRRGSKQYMRPKDLRNLDRLAGSHLRQPRPSIDRGLTGSSPQLSLIAKLKAETQ
jgi:hypothetical protein